MKVIYKYPLEIKEKQEILLPDNHQILDVQVQNNIPCLWVLLDSDDLKPSSTHSFNIFLYATGQQFIDCGLNYISTFQMMQGSYIIHAFWNWTGK